MKNLPIFLSLFLSIGIFSCKKEVASNGQVGDYASFGEKFQLKEPKTKEEMLTLYQGMQEGDTLQLAFASDKVSGVCKVKGCWMKLELDSATNAMVRFKEYAFFVPTNAEGSQAVVNGKAFLDVQTVEQLKHYAEDAGKTKEEIEKITEPISTYSFEATGVLLK